jgi:hypothetical protein
MTRDAESPPEARSGLSQTDRGAAIQLCLCHSIPDMEERAVAPRILPIPGGQRPPLLFTPPPLPGEAPPVPAMRRK